eukprot:GEMP01033276.1.p1 GENE.GEMP01033276.1~~GEMP01033276.1.p1  ORF type:complete len:193 (+),score=34.62 GEMP01033276.1:116-694(+)
MPNVKNVTLTDFLETTPTENSLGYFSCLSDPPSGLVSPHYSNTGKQALRHLKEDERRLTHGESLQKSHQRSWMRRIGEPVNFQRYMQLLDKPKGSKTQAGNGNVHSIEMSLRAILQCSECAPTFEDWRYSHSVHSRILLPRVSKPVQPARKSLRIRSPLAGCGKFLLKPIEVRKVSGAFDPFVGCAFEWQPA